MSTTPETQQWRSKDPRISEQKIGSFLDALSSKSPVPGGGAVAGVIGATSAATAGMVLHYTLGKAKFAHHESTNTQALEELTQIRTRMLTLADDDAKGYQELNALWSLPKDDPSRIARWDNAVRGAITPPLTMLEDSVRLIRILSGLVETTNTQLRSDLEISIMLAINAAQSASCNVRVNIPLLPDNEQSPMRDTMTKALDEVQSIGHDAQQRCKR